MRPTGIAPFWATETNFDKGVDPDVPTVDDGTPTRNPPSNTRKLYGYPPDLAPSATEYNNEFGRATDWIRYLDGIDARSFTRPVVVAAGVFSGPLGSAASAVLDPLAWNPILQKYHVVAGQGQVMGTLVGETYADDTASNAPTVTVQGSVVCTKLGWCVANVGTTYHLYGRNASAAWAASVLDANATTYRLCVDDTEAGGDPVMVWGAGENTSTTKAGCWCVTEAAGIFTLTHQSLPSPLAWTAGFKVFFAAGPTRKVFAVLDNSNAVHIWDAPVSGAAAHTWTSRGTGTFGAMSDLFYSATDGLFVALVGDDCYVSGNGIAWISRGSLPSGGWTFGAGARALGGSWLAFAIPGPSGATNALAVSEDQGLTWELMPHPNPAPTTQKVFALLGGQSMGGIDPVWGLSGNVNIPAVTQNVATNLGYAVEIQVPKWSLITTIRASVKGSAGHGALPATMPRLRVDQVTYAGALTNLANVVDASGSTGAYETAHSITTGAVEYTANDGRILAMAIGEGSTNSQVGLALYGIETTYYPPGANALGGPGTIVVLDRRACVVNGLRATWGLRTRT